MRSRSGGLRVEGGDGHQGPKQAEGVKKLRAEAHERGNLVTTIVGSSGGSGSSWTRRARAPEEGAQVGRLEKQSQELWNVW